MKVSTASRVEEIWAELREEILRGQYRPGERLPSERDLAARFGANRGAVREALKKLEQMGIADITPGGVRVVPVEEATLDVLGYILALGDRPDPTLLSQVLEVLGALMSMSAGKAVEAADDAQIEAMQSIVGRLIETRGNREQQSELWNQLGLLFTSVNENLVLRLILNGVKTQFVGLKSPEESDVRLDSAQDAQILARIAENLSNRDARAVAAAVEDHFVLVRETVVDAVSRMNEQSRSVSNG